MRLMRRRGVSRKRLGTLSLKESVGDPGEPPGEAGASEASFASDFPGAGADGNHPD
jgi:hypothetical protein